MQREFVRTESRLASSRGRQSLAIAIAVGTIFCGRAAHANTGIMLETISDYTFFSNGSTGNNTDANTEGAGFWNAMTAANTGWSQQVWFQDSLVYDTDFFDPDLTGVTTDNDSQNFDVGAAAISFFIGHGTCNDITNTACNTDADCGANAYCPKFPLTGGQQSACINIAPKNLVISSSGSKHGNLVKYGDSPTNPQPLSIALGESVNSGSFAGVGTNGGTNIAIITNSCGMRFRIRSQDQNHFYSGVHEVMMNMPVGNIKGTTSSTFADTAQWSARGSTLANLILTNVNAAASSAWLTPSFTNNNYNGAGANIVGAYDTTGTAASNRLSGETWVQSRSETRDATSAAAGVYFYQCNFSNCSSFAL